MSGEPSLLDRTERAIEWYRGSGHVVPDPTTGTGAIRLLEATMRSQLGLAACLAVDSCTSALFVAMHAAGIAPGVEVVLPADEWGASRAVAAVLGASVQCAPVTADTGVVTVESMVRAISASTRAAVLTHGSGERAPVAAVERRTAGQGVAIIEDAAAAPIEDIVGAQPVGRIGRFACFSFGPGKAIDAGGGGMIAVRDQQDVEAVIRLSQHPARQMLFGLSGSAEALNFRIHPVAAVVALHTLHECGLEAGW